MGVEVFCAMWEGPDVAAINAVMRSVFEGVEKRSVWVGVDEGEGMVCGNSCSEVGV